MNNKTKALHLTAAWSRPRTERLIALAAAVILALTLFAQTSHASHYYLTDVDWFETPQVIKFRDNGIQTTKHFLAATLTQKDRATLASKVEVSEETLLKLAKECELLQIKGVGPKVVRMLQAAGVTSVADLGSRAPAELVKRLAATNKAKKFTETNPGLDHVSYWVGQAKKASFHVK